MNCHFTDAELNTIFNDMLNQPSSLDHSLLNTAHLSNVNNNLQTMNTSKSLLTGSGQITESKIINKSTCVNNTTTTRSCERTL